MCLISVGEQQADPGLEDSTTEENDSTSPYELWEPSPSAVCEYDVKNFMILNTLKHICNMFFFILNLLFNFLFITINGIFKW